MNDYQAHCHTPLGLCTIVYSDAGLRSMKINEARATTAAAPSPWAKKLLARVQHHLGGKPQDFTDVDLDWQGITAFRQQVYQLARQIPAGATSTYGTLAKELGKPRGARAVGQALGANPFLLVVPCHRVLASNGALRGFSAAGGLKTKAVLLDLERQS